MQGMHCRWMLVDPGLGMVDFDREKFDYSHELWLKMQKGEIDPNRYGSPGKGAGFASIMKVCHDLASLLEKNIQPTIMHPCSSMPSQTITN